MTMHKLFLCLLISMLSVALFGQGQMSKDEVAIIKKLNGIVYFTDFDTQTREVASTGQRLKKGMFIETGPNGNAELVFYNGSTVAVSSSAMFTIDNFNRKKAVKLNVESGEFSSTVKQNIKLSLTTNDGSITQIKGDRDGSEMALRISELGTPVVQVSKGVAKVNTPSGEAVTLEKDKEAKVTIKGETVVSNIETPISVVVVAPIGPANKIVTHEVCDQGYQNCVSYEILLQAI